MNILGVYGAIQWNGNAEDWLHDSGCTLFKNGTHICSISEERLSEIKYDGNYPESSIELCLKKGNITNDDVDLIMIPSLCLQIFYIKWKNYEIENFFKEKFRNARIEIVGHHICHASASIFSTEINEGSFFTCDGSGSLFYSEYPLRFKDVEKYSIGHFNKKEKIFNIYPNTYVDLYVNDFGNFYSYGSFLSYCKMINKKIEYFDGEMRETYPGKIMGLSAYGDHEKISKKESDYFYLNEDMHYMPKIMPKNVNLDKLAQVYDAKDLAAWIQYQFEKYLLIYFKVMREKKYFSNNICLGGGIFLNVLFNTKLKKTNLFDNIHIFPATNDAGLHFGAAAYGNFISNIENKIPENIALLGNQYSNDQIEKSLIDNDKFLHFEKLNDNDLVEKTSESLIENKVIAWFQDKSEFGPRALGSRSILMNPQKQENKNILNQRVKHRESWRPFAGIMPEKYLTEWFEENFESEYMLYSYHVKNRKIRKIPAITHHDKTCRIQTLKSKDSDKKIYKLLETMNRKINVPILLNTSFNDNGKPIVETPKNAIDSFIKLDIDVLVIGNFYVTKKGI